MRRQLPFQWARLANPSHASFKGSTQPGEHFTFQLAAYTPYVGVAISSVTFTDLVFGSTGTPQGRSVDSAASPCIPASAIHTLNFAGVDFWGRNFTVNKVAIAAGEIHSMWVAVVVPSTAAGIYHGSATVTAQPLVGEFSSPSSPSSQVQFPVTITLAVEGAVLPDGGDRSGRTATRSCMSCLHTHSL